MARRRYELPGDLGPASLEARRAFYRGKMDYRTAERWMARPRGDRAYALILGRHSGIYPRRFRSLKNVPLIVDDVRGPRDLRPFLVKYLPEGVYYDRNVYASLAEARRAGVDYAHAWRSRHFLGQELAFDLDPENLDCPIHGDIADKMRRGQGLSFCDWEFEEVRGQAAELYDELSRRWTRLRVVYSGRGFHIHVFDEAGFRLNRRERGTIAREVARRYAIDEWVTSGEMRLIRLPYSLHGMVSRIVIPVDRSRLERFRYDDHRARPRGLRP
ncbi:MAG TPA: DNA primase [Thermoplasmata archaeon]|nr:DNA primase [Thermoplasmata archaeon]